MKKTIFLLLLTAFISVHSFAAFPSFSGQAGSVTPVLEEKAGTEEALPEPGAAAEAVFPPDGEGRAFRSDQLHKIEPAFDVPVQSMETWIRFPAESEPSLRGGIMLGSYRDYGRSFSLEIYTAGNPRVYIRTLEGQVYSWIFTQVNVYTGEWVHLALVYDEAAGEIRCYADGELKETAPTEPGESLLSPKASCALGGDYRNGNTCFFKGRMKALALFSDVRTGEEILADAESGGLDPEDRDLIAGYLLPDCGDGEKESDLIPDIGKNRHDAKYMNAWMREKAPVGEYAYSFAVVGDTQTINYYAPDKLSAIYDWIAANVEKKKIKFVFGMGDITEMNSQPEWERAAQNMAKLDGLVPYSFVRGNHDHAKEFARAFPYDRYRDALGGSYDDTMLNTWQLFTVGRVPYLVLSIDYGASDDVLAWANEVVRNHRNCNVIVTTHAYLFRDGTTLDVHEVCPPSLDGAYNNGDDIWEKLITKHPNIVLVLCGHDPSDRIVAVRSQGENGNTVTQMLIDPQGVDAAYGAAGMVAMLYFSEDGSQVAVEYYSTVKNRFFMEENQFTVRIDLMKPREIAEIRMETPPDKTRYRIGEALQLAGAAITVRYADGGSETVKVSRNLISRYDAFLEGTQEITVRYCGFTASFPVTVTLPVPKELTSEAYRIAGGLIGHVGAGTTVSQLLSGIKEGKFCRVYRNGKELTDRDAVGTGAVVRILDGETVCVSATVSVTGDLNGDGQITVSDLLLVKAGLLSGETPKEGAVRLASDLNGDGEISVTDFLAIKAVLLGKE